MRKHFVLLLSLILIFFFLSCSSKITEQENLSHTDEAAIASQEIISEEAQSIVLDYVDVILNSDFYNNKEVLVAGRIAAFSITSRNEFDFRDRLGFEEAGNGFTVRLAKKFSYGESAEDYYDVGQYVLVKGTWKSGHYSCLNNATVLSSESEAKTYSDMFMARWTSKGQSYSNTLPITDYMDIIDNPKTFDGQRIRTAGEIQALGTNNVTRYIYFSFRNRKTNSTCISFSLKGCPSEMQNLCKEGQYIVLSGVVRGTGGSVSITDCFVECVGDEAELLSAQTTTAWSENYRNLRTNYIATCEQYSYNELARFPEKHMGSPIEISGRVLQIESVWGEDLVLLDVGGNNLVYINYTGKQYRDPEILQNDKIIFYGECSGKTTYTTILGQDNTIPLITAFYSSVNQQ